MTKDTETYSGASFDVGNSVVDMSCDSLSGGNQVSEIHSVELRPTKSVITCANVGYEVKNEKLNLHSLEETYGHEVY